MVLHRDTVSEVGQTGGNFGEGQLGNLHEAPELRAIPYQRGRKQRG